jgi:hypothetical protein
LLGVAIKYDEVEVLNPAAEQIGDRKGDQRQFIDRRAVSSFLRRPQYSEMHEVDISVRFQQIAPHSLTGMRLAGDQQHPKFVAHALDIDHSPIAVGDDLAFDRGNLQFDHIWARMVDRRLHIYPLPDLGVDCPDCATITPHRKFDRLAMIGAVEDARLDDLIFAHNAVARRLNQLDSALPLALVAGDQRVQRRIKTKRGRRFRNVVRVAIRNEDRPSNPLRRRIGKDATQSGEEFGPFGFGFVARRFNGPDFDVPKRLEARLEFVARFVRLLWPLADIRLSERSTTIATISLSGRRFS